MRLHGRFTDIEPMGDLLVQQALAQHAQDDLLLRGEAAEGLGDADALRIAGSRLFWMLVEHCLAAQYRPDGRHDLACTGRLAEIAHRTMGPNELDQASVFKA